MQALDGTRVELEWSCRAHFVPGLHLCVVRDVTERKQAERELQRKQQELTDFVENATIDLHWKRKADPRLDDFPRLIEDDEIFPTRLDLTFAFIPGSSNARPIRVTTSDGNLISVLQ